MDKNKTILLVDDDPDDRALFFEALQELDATITPSVILSENWSQV